MIAEELAPYLLEPPVIKYTNDDNSKNIGNKRSINDNILCTFNIIYMY